MKNEKTNYAFSITVLYRTVRRYGTYYGKVKKVEFVGPNLQISVLDRIH
jgi:hypothetical protein